MICSRQEAVAFARTWIKTPYVLRGRVKGAGVDCATLIAEFLIEIGAASPADLEEIGFYSNDWFCHTSDERYLRNLMRFGTLVMETVCRLGEKPQPGDLVLFKVAGSRIYNHGAIVTAWPYGIHAEASGVKEVNLAAHFLTAYRQMDICDPFQERS